jgi:hypothetical protein
MCDPESQSDSTKPKFWNRLDEVSCARSLRLAVIGNLYREDQISREDAIEILSGCLEPGNESTKYDDSQWLDSMPVTLAWKVDTPATKGE